MPKRQTCAHKNRDLRTKSQPRTPSRLKVEHLEDRSLPTAANSAFVSLLYTDLMHRSADAGGLAAWTAALDQGTLNTMQVAFDFATSPEFRTLEVNNAYQQLLKRAPESAGQAAWVGYLNQGHSQSEMLAGIASSPEFFQDAGGTNSGFLNALYQDAFGRAPDASGAATWGGALAAGMSRFQVALDIFTSPEIYTDLVTSFYHDFLGRAPDAGGLAAWVGALESGMSQDMVIAGIAGSAEFFARAQSAPPASSAPAVTPPANQTNNEGDVISGLTVTSTPGNGSGLTFAATGLPPGVSINAATGVISGALSGQSAGNYTVHVSASDGTNTGTAQFTWAVKDITTPAVTAPANQTNNQGATVSGVTVTATDADNDTLTFGASSLPPGLSIDSTTGVISGTLTSTSAGNFTVTVTASDGFNTGSATFQWTVVNPAAPVVTPPANQTNDEGDTVSGVTVTATGGNGGTLTFGATNLPPGLSINPTTGAITGTLTGQSAGSYTVQVTASDGTNTGSAQFTWMVKDVTTPVVTAPANQTNNTGDTVSGVTVTATDADGDTLTFGASGLPAGLSINSTTGVISGTLTTASAGIFTVTVTASDGFNTGSATFQWTVTNPAAPVVTAPSDQTNNEGDTVNGVTVTATGGNGGTLTFGATRLPPGLSINATTGAITGTLTGQSAGSYTVEVTASDGTNTGFAEFHWAVADVTTPVVTAPADQTNNEGATVTGVTVTATDADGDTLTFGATGLPAGLSINSTTGAITGTLAAGSAGNYTVTVTASDGFNTGSATFQWTVVNPNPVVTPPVDQTNNEGDAVSGVTVTATGGNGGTLTFGATGLPPGLSINSTTGEITGTLTGQSAGSYTVTVSATDGTDTGSAQFTWMVKDITTPVVTAPANQTNNTGDTVSGVTVTATDADGDTLTFAATNLPAGLSIDSTTGVISGTLTTASAGIFTVTVTASDGFNTGSATFQWTVTNPAAPVVTPPADQTSNEGDTISGVTLTATGGNGGLTFGATGLPPGLSLNATTGEITGMLTGQSAGSYTVEVTASDGTNIGFAEFHWTVADVTTPVVTPPADQTGNEGDTVSGVTATATDADGDTLTFGATGLPAGLNIDATTGAITGTLAAASAGSYTVTVTANDGFNTGSATFHWSVVNPLAPVVTPPADQSNNEGDTVSGVTATATGGNGGTLIFAATGLPAGLSINSMTGEITGTLTGQSAGSYTVTVSATDGTNTGSATFHWGVADTTVPAVTPPADQNSNEGVKISGVTVAATDSDGDTLTYAATSLPPGLSIDATTGEISGTVPAGSAGMYTVTVTASDGFNTGSGTFQWTVVDAGSPAVTPPADQNSNEGDTVSGVFVTATGGNGNPLTFAATGLPPGLSINATTGEITGTLTGQSAGSYTVTVTANDGLNTGSATFKWTVADVTTPAVTAPPDQNSQENAAISGLFVTAVDADGDPLSFAATNLPPGLTINPATGEITGTIAAGSAGTYTVEVTASDGFNTGTAMFQWVVMA
jgi:DUF971 family protein